MDQTYAPSIRTTANRGDGLRDAASTGPGKLIHSEKVDIRSDLMRVALQPIEHEFEVGECVFVTLDNVKWKEGVVTQCPPSDLKFDPPPSKSGLPINGTKPLPMHRSRPPLKSILRNGTTRPSPPASSHRPYYKQWLVQIQNERSGTSECILSPLEGRVKPQTPFYSLIIRNLQVAESKVLQTDQLQSTDW
ncbi:hypothetical protein SCHPADRAFT_995245 [Schizopora paradoxa]|uniref:Uncharacterized protein n=1 Tax=Schizopora paradoxa TaxID=27342 RepID=A0A0H2S3E9_9AGAM|nr:hypothetical protein SCHPADRAFT_995245 [Schizopora paradoxa]